MDAFQNALAQPSPIQKELYSFFEPQAALTIFDIGSCDGLDSIRYGRTFPNATVRSFEPIPKNFEKIQANIQNLGVKNVVPHSLALSNTTGTIQMFVSSGSSDGAADAYNKSSSLLEPEGHITLYPQCHFDTTIDVATETLDNFCLTNTIQEIDFIHLDVQGAELLVLEGAKKILPNIKVIWLEVETVGLYKDQPLKKDVEAFMRSRNFAIARYDFRFISGDQLYINKDFLRTTKKSIFWKVRLTDVFIANFFFLIYTRAVVKKIFRKLFKL